MRRLDAHDPALEARIESFELAYRMQGEAAEAFDISREPDSIRALYGPGTQARQLLDHAPVDRARSALYPGLERGRTALGRPRKPDVATIASSPANGTRPSPLS